MTVRKIDFAEDIDNDYCMRPLEKYRPYLTFSENAKIRFGSIMGYIMCLKDTGNEQVAKAMWDDLQDNLGRLVRKHEHAPWAVDGASLQGDEDPKENIRVPSLKAYLHDDGTKHGFGFSVYRPISPTTYEAALEEARKERQKQVGDQTPMTHLLENLAVSDVVSQMQIEPSLEETVRGPDGETLTIRYRFVYNGGLLYHGPGAGQTFSVVIGNANGKAIYWSIHT